MVAHGSYPPLARRTCVQLSLLCMCRGPSMYFFVICSSGLLVVSSNARNSNHLTEWGRFHRWAAVRGLEEWMRGPFGSPSRDACTLSGNCEQPPPPPHMAKVVAMLRFETRTRGCLRSSQQRGLIATSWSPSQEKMPCWFPATC